MPVTHFLSFPDFNIWSSPLLILVLQGLVLIALLLSKFFKGKNVSHLFLAMILIIVCYEQICYTVGFMGWYQEFPYTKINYWLIPMSLALAPMIYFYLRSVTTSNFVFRKKDWLHFVPAISLILYRVVIYSYDAFQPGFNDNQNGYLKIHLDEPIVQPLLMFLEFAQMLLYLAFTFQLFYQYRKKITAYFSNTYKYELNWLLSFLLVFTVLFLYGSLQDIIGALITDLSYTQRWWLNLLMAVATIYIGIKGLYTDISRLSQLEFNFTPEPNPYPVTPEEFQVNPVEMEKIRKLMEDEKPYLDPELNLVVLAQQSGMNRAELSQLINSGFQMNFNDFVNGYRIEEVKKQLSEGKQEQLSLLGIALECGFNSKATFNRVFKKITHISPTEFLKTLQ